MRKVLGQSAPGATTETALYTVPGAKTALVSSYVVCNRGGTDTTFRVYIGVAGEAAANKQYLHYGEPIQANSTFVGTIGITMSQGDVLRVYAGNANLSFTAFGIEE